MEQDAVKCAQFVLSLHNDGYYVDNATLTSAQNIMNDYVYKNDCMDDVECGEMDDYDDDDE